MSEILEYLSNVREAEDLAIRLAKDIGSKHKITLFKTYQNAFLHKDAVAWIVAEKSFPKSKAEQKVKDLLKFNAIHVASESKKKDEILYYVDAQVLKKSVEEPQVSRKSAPRSPKSVRSSQGHAQGHSRSHISHNPNHNSFQPQRQSQQPSSQINRASRSMSQEMPTSAEREFLGGEQLKTQLEIGLLMFMKSYAPAKSLKQEVDKTNIWSDVAKKKV